MIDATPQITPEQIRAARKLLGWSRERLAFKSNTTLNFIRQLEYHGRVAPVFWRSKDFDGLAAIRATLETAGVEFTNGGEPGVKLRRSES